MNKKNNNTKKRDKRYIEKIFHRYTELYSDLVSKYSSLTDEQRFTAINQFDLVHRIVEHYYFYREDVLDDDMLFNSSEKVLDELEKAHQKYIPQKKTKSKK